MVSCWGTTPLSPGNRAIGIDRASMSTPWSRYCAVGHGSVAAPWEPRKITLSGTSGSLRVLGVFAVASLLLLTTALLIVRSSWIFRQRLRCRVHGALEPRAISARSFADKSPYDRHASVVAPVRVYPN